MQRGRRSRRATLQQSQGLSASRRFSKTLGVLNFALPCSKCFATIREWQLQLPPVNRHERLTYFRHYERDVSVFCSGNIQGS